MSIETKSIDINIDYEENECIKYGAIYCYDIIYWNLRHCPLNSKAILIDNIRCFDIKHDVKGAISICFNIIKKELTFSCNILKDFIYQEIKNRVKYESFTIENFTKQFISFFSSVSDFVSLRELQYCNNCHECTYQLTYKHLCNRCHVKSINARHADCIKCKEHKKVEPVEEKKGGFKKAFLKIKSLFKMK